MTIETAVFTLRDKIHGEIVVAFAGDVVTVVVAGAEHRIPNPPAKWGGRPLKPRASDAFSAALQAIKPPVVAPAKANRGKEGKPALSVHRG